MSTTWKVIVIAIGLLASLAAGMAIGALSKLDVEIAQDADAPVMIDLTQVILRYQDPMRGIGLEEITVRSVIQDALWYKINDTRVDEETRAECFAMTGLFHEGRATEITQAQYDILTGAIAEVWGPAVIQEFNELVGGEQ